MDDTLKSALEQWWLRRNVYFVCALADEILAEGRGEQQGERFPEEAMDAACWAAACRSVAIAAHKLVNVQPLLRLAIDLEEEASTIKLEMRKLRPPAEVLKTRAASLHGAPPTIDVLRDAQATVQLIEIQGDIAIDRGAMANAEASQAAMALGMVMQGKPMTEIAEALGIRRGDLYEKDEWALLYHYARSRKDARKQGRRDRGERTARNSGQIPDSQESLGGA